MHVAGLVIMKFPLGYCFALLNFVLSWLSLNFFQIETKVLRVSSNKKTLKTANDINVEK